MCHSHWSSVMLPSDAPIPPWAATVCDRVGKTLDRTATLSPAWASCRAQRMPAPPAPTITASKRRRPIATMSDLPENLHCPDQAGGQPDDGPELKHQPDSGGTDVVHPNIAHSDPGVIRKRDERDQRCDLHGERHEDCRPRLVVDRPR